jgi:hypothetical protein
MDGGIADRVGGHHHPILHVFDGQPPILRP